MPELDWKGKEFEALLRRHLGNALEEIGVYCRDQIKRSMPRRVSRPGESPGVRSGVYRRLVSSEVDRARVRARVGTNDIRGLWFEKGTGLYGPRGRNILIPRAFGKSGSASSPGMKPRPHIFRIVRRSGGAVKGILQKHTRGLL